MNRDEILYMLFHMPWKTLAAKADAVRRAGVGEHVHIRGLIEFSNRCACDCLYCGLRHSNTALQRYLLSPETILRVAREAAEAGVDTVVLQSGEAPLQKARVLAGIITDIKGIKTKEGSPLAVTLSVGERRREEYSLWREAGADRFLLKHETADAAVYAALHPGRTLAQRLRSLRRLRECGYAVGSGFMVGLPGQKPESLADDILLARELEVDMCGVGPFIPQTDTPLGRHAHGSVELSLRAMAVLRIALPKAHLPATTALATLAPDTGQREALRAGANVLMPSFTPSFWRDAYCLYDGKHRVGMREARSVIAAAHGALPAF